MTKNQLKMLHFMGPVSGLWALICSKFTPRRATEGLGWFWHCGVGISRLDCIIECYQVLPGCVRCIVSFFICNRQMTPFHLMLNKSGILMRKTQRTPYFTKLHNICNRQWSTTLYQGFCLCRSRLEYVLPNSKQRSTAVFLLKWQGQPV